MKSTDWRAKGCLAYFLTHIHADHTQGLTDRWNRGRIYTSKVTERLLKTKLPELQATVMGMSLGVPVTLEFQTRTGCAASVLV